MTTNLPRVCIALLLFVPGGCDDSPSGPHTAGDDATDGGDDAGDAGGDETGGGNDPDPDPDSVAFFLPTDTATNTGAPQVAVDRDGGMHAVYPAYAGGDAFYAYCAPGCAASEDVRVVRLASAGTVANAMLALDPAGRPRVLLSSYAHVDYAQCTSDCTDASAWTVTPVVVHDGERQVTGEAFALDADGRPRFVMHTYVVPLGIGQGPPITEYVACDDGCDDPQRWTVTPMAEQIWRSSSLRFDAQGRAHLATAAIVEGIDGAPSQDAAAYAHCDSDCTDSNRWIGVSLEVAYTDRFAAVTIDPAISLALTHEGQPRIAVLATSSNGMANVTYLACDDDCTGAGWRGVVLVEQDGLGAGIDLALDDADRPRLVHTYGADIGYGRCDAADCVDPAAQWTLGPVERGSDIPIDDIYLWPNCTVAAWFLHSPTVAIGSTGVLHVGYQARDITGGWNNPDPSHTPDCVAGTDMTWSRVARRKTH